MFTISGFYLHCHGLDISCPPKVPMLLKEYLEVKWFDDDSCNLIGTF